MERQSSEKLRERRCEFLRVQFILLLTRKFKPALLNRLQFGGK